MVVGLCVVDLDDFEFGALLVEANGAFFALGSNLPLGAARARLLVDAPFEFALGHVQRLQLQFARHAHRDGGRVFVNCLTERLVELPTECIS